MGLTRGRALVACGVLSMIGGAWACSQGDPQPPYIPDPPGKDGSVTVTDGGGDAKTACAFDDGGCNTLENCGSKVYIVEVAQNGVAGQGGTVLDGTYYLTDYRVLTGSGGTNQTTSAYFAETMSFVTTSVGDAGTGDASIGDASVDASLGEAGAPPQNMVWEDIIASNVYPQSSATSGVANFSGATVTITHTCPNSNNFS